MSEWFAMPEVCQKVFRIVVKKQPSFPKAALRFLDLIFTGWFSIPSVLPVSARVSVGSGWRDWPSCQR